MSRRRTLNETKELLLATGADMLAGDTPKVTVGRLDLTEVSRHAGFTTAGSAYKIWETQEDYRIEVLRHVLRAIPADRSPIDALRSIVVDDPDALPTFTELIRNITITGSSAWAADITLYTVYLALWTASPGDPELAGELHDADVEIIGAYAELYAAVMDAYDLEFIPPYDASMFATTVSAISEGFTVREGATPHVFAAALERPTGEDGAVQEWSLFGCAVQAIITAFVRPRTQPAEVPEV